MAELIEVAKKDELQNGSMKEVTAGGHKLLLARVNDNYYATDLHCPHLGGNLAHGKLEGSIVTCPWHSSQFDLSNGQVIRWVDKTGPIAALSKAIKHEKPLTTYKVVVQEDSVAVEI
jgi:nitrite reductase/ring-hydroxylating ferredoxin subunit